MSDFAKSVQNLVQIAEDLEHRSTENNHLIRSTARILKSHQSDKNDCNEI
jgi:ABC-type transporter Mla subunit MlaD